MFKDAVFALTAMAKMRTQFKYFKKEITVLHIKSKVTSKCCDFFPHKHQDQYLIWKKLQYLFILLYAVRRVNALWATFLTKMWEEIGLTSLADFAKSRVMDFKIATGKSGG